MFFDLVHDYWLLITVISLTSNGYSWIETFYTIQLHTHTRTDQDKEIQFCQEEYQSTGQHWAEYIYNLGTKIWDRCQCQLSLYPTTILLYTWTIFKKLYIKEIKMIWYTSILTVLSTVTKSMSWGRRNKYNIQCPVILRWRQVSVRVYTMLQGNQVSKTLNL